MSKKLWIGERENEQGRKHLELCIYNKREEDGKLELQLTP